MRNGIAYLFVAVLASACGSSGGDDDDDNDDADAGPVVPGVFGDALTPMDSVSAQGSHILETRAHPDGRVIYCSGRRGLTIVDASNPSALDEVTTLDGASGNRCQHLRWSGDLIYFTNRGSDLAETPFVSVFDLSGLPRGVAEYTHPTWLFEGLDVVGDMVYVAVHEDGLSVLQYTGGSTLTLRGNTPTAGNAWAVAANGTMLYVADGAGGVSVVDASTPTNPQLRGTVDVGGPAQSIEYDASQQVAYVAAGSAGLIAVDVSNPDAPAILDVVDTPGSAVQVYLDGDYAYVADWNDARVFDKRNPSDLTLFATERVVDNRAFTRVLGIAARDGVTFIGEWSALYSYEQHDDRAAPDIWADDLAIDFGTVSASDVDAVAVIVRNEGTEPLALTDASINTGSLSIDPTQMTLQPGAAGVFELTFSPTSDAAMSAVLTLSSDDPDEADFEIEVVGNQPGIGVGDPSPNVTGDLLTGGTWSLSDEAGSPVLIAYFATF